MPLKNVVKIFCYKCHKVDRQIVLERCEAMDEGHSRGLTEGISKGQLEEIISSVREGDYIIERGAEKLGITVKEFEGLM